MGRTKEVPYTGAENGDAEELHTYYCKFSGRQVSEIYLSGANRSAPQSFNSSNDFHLKTSPSIPEKAIQESDPLLLLQLFEMLPDPYRAHLTKLHDACSHALSTDCDLSKAPRRCTDGSIVLDTDFYTVRLYAKDGGVKLLRRASGAVERQLRVNMGQLPIAYRCGCQSMPCWLARNLICLRMSPRIAEDKEQGIRIMLDTTVKY